VWLFHGDLSDDEVARVYAMKTYKALEIQLHFFSASALDCQYDVSNNYLIVVSVPK
jgi:hypothetical protein